jgi:CHAT domain-containing protein
MVKHFKTQVIQTISMGLMLTLGLGWATTGAIAQVMAQSGESPPPFPETPPIPETPPAPSPTLPGLEDTTSPNPSEIVPSNPGSVGPSVKTPPLTGEPAQIIEQLETYQSQPYASYLGLNLYGELTGADQISQTLQQLAKKTGTNPALVYVLSTGNVLKLVLVLPGETTAPSPSRSWLPALDLRLASMQPWRILAQAFQPSSPAPKLISYVVPSATSAALKRTIKTFRGQVSDPQKTNSTSYQASAKQLYDWIIAPLQPTLEARRIDTLVFSLDKGFRAMPIAALYDGKQFLVEKYSLALIPSFSLTDTRFQDIKGSKMLGMGISQSAGGLPALPAVSVEVPTLTEKIWQGTGYLDQQVTLEQFQSLAQREQFGIVHLATHAEFNPGNLNESFIQFWNGRLTLSKLRRIALSQKWNSNPTLEMLVLSACQTALGSDQAELGFTGLAVQTGVKTVLGSLWSISDEGTLGLMSEFYRNLKTAPIRAAALRDAQLSLLRGQVSVTNGQLTLTDGSQVVLPAGSAQNSVNLTHPYFWAAYTVVGNWN